LKIEHLTYASSSSVYGANRKQPFSEDDQVGHPLSLYAATKRSNELMAHSYSSLFQIPTTGLRFFTVYGPWGRPDMALFKFTDAILNHQPIEVFNHGHHRRDFTYIDDIADGVILASDSPAIREPDWDGMKPKQSSSEAPFRLYNIGGQQPVELIRMIEILEDCLGKKAIKVMKPMQAGDVAETCANYELFESDFSFRPKISLETGIRKFVEWYLAFRARNS
jgi:UDP-glucuronate 4-epimerase